MVNAMATRFNPDDPLELAAARMTRFLARQPRSAKTRAYLASLPKRGKIVVKPEDYPLVTRSDALADYRLQLIRDAQRYADWERRGKPPSPTVAPRKDRMRPRRGHDPHRERLYRAQEGKCGLCGGEIFDPRGATLDHVIPRALGGRNFENLLLAHKRCNNLKADRPPTSCELETLAAVNERLAKTEGADDANL
jgi:5-methylcytosine-specific restriction endonuclease McrA